MMYVLALFFLFSVIPSIALDTQEYDEFVTAIQECDEKKVLELKETCHLTSEEQEKLYAIAHQTAYELQEYCKMLNLLNPYFFTPVPKQLKQMYKQYAYNKKFF